MSLRTGIIIRSTARGLATQTQEAWRGYPFDAALHVLDGNPIWPENLWPVHRPNDVYEAHLKDGELVRSECEEFLSRVDLVFSVETLYSDTFTKMLMHRSIRSIVQANCELWRSTQPATLATKWVYPTPWRLSDVPDGPTLPVPTATVCNAVPGALGDPLVVVHPAGHRAVGDRNGTDLVIEALRLVKRPVTLRMIGQDGPGSLPARLSRIPPHVELDVIDSGVADRWSIYDGAHAVLLPRRYGGLCLPVQEAMQVGLVPLMTDCEPNRWWPIVPIQASKGRNQRTPYGLVPTWIAHPRFIARRIDELTETPERVAAGRARSLQWAEEHSWDRLAPLYTDLFQSRL